MPSIFPFRIACTLDEVVVVSTKDLSFDENLYEMKKMELLSEVTYNMYQASSLFYLEDVAISDVVHAGNHSKGRDTWKGKYEEMEQKCLVVLQELADFVEKA